MHLWKLERVHFSTAHPDHISKSSALSQEIHCQQAYEYGACPDKTSLLLFNYSTQ